ncbi:SDR family NAD(P)-dependent oxidoreductase [Aspergillus foveolatus]|uniref:SDR family NAD(P)-dependent oxidoreductase n=1 Tax=Aspergillus foveolatus TaxID=210207 RepID=UPI003CCCD077
MTNAFPKYADLHGKIALVMGIGQSRIPGSDIWGNGAAIARLLAHSGAKVFGCDLSLDAAEYTAGRIRSEGGTCDVMQADATSLSEVRRVAAAALARHGRIDILVNNVGATATGDPASIPEELWDQQQQLNMKTVYLACHVILPIMEKQGSGVVVNNASIAGLRYIGKPQVAYSAAKAAVIHFTRVTAVMYAPRGVRMNSVSPGLVYTPLVEGLRTNGQEDAYWKIMEQPIPIGRMGDAFDVANATVFLASDAAKYITGQNLVVDGGFTSSAVSKL